MDEVEVQWRVTWFPPGSPARSRTGPEGLIRMIAADDEWVEGCNPIIEFREIRTGPWRIARCGAEIDHDPDEAGICRRCGASLTIVLRPDGRRIGGVPHPGDDDARASPD